MEEKAGAQISTRSFIQSFIILLLFMLLAGVLTQIVPAGRYERVVQDGRQVINPVSFQFVPRPDYPIWRWLTAPLEVLAGPDGFTVIVIILFLLMVGGSFAVLDKSRILQSVVVRLVANFGGRKYALLLAITFFFMLMGACFGIFEEIVPLVPLMIALAYSLGWDSLVGLGMSILATNLGFSAALANPFTLGVAQKIAGLPLFSGIEWRIPIFVAIYAVLAGFLVLYARRIDRQPELSSVYQDDQRTREKFKLDATNAQMNPLTGRAIVWFVMFLALIIAVLIASPFVEIISDLALPIVGLLFVIAGVGAGVIAGTTGKNVWRAFVDGVFGIAPSIPLILMAASVKYIVAQGSVMDTFLYGASQALAQANPLVAVVMVYALTLFLELFVPSGSAKAFLLMPILVPLADLTGITRQVVVTAYCFGDGFSNLAYPTNPVLLIALGLTVATYPKWIRWTLGLWLVLLVVTVAFLGLGVALRWGPF